MPAFVHPVADFHGAEPESISTAHHLCRKERHLLGHYTDALTDNVFWQVLYACAHAICHVCVKVKGPDVAAHKAVFLLGRRCAWGVSKK